MKKRTSFAITTAVVAGVVGFGVAPAYAATACPSNNVCSYDEAYFSGTMWTGGNGNFVEVVDDRTDSIRNTTTNNYNAKNNTAWGNEETVVYIASGGSVSNLSGNSNKIDHYRKA